jgi:hypothetical protein
MQFAFKGPCLVVLNINPTEFVCTFLITVHRLSKTVDSTSPCLGPESVSKLSDIHP